MMKDSGLKWIEDNADNQTGGYQGDFDDNEIKNMPIPKFK